MHTSVLHILVLLHTEEFPAVLLQVGNENVKQLFYTIVCYLMTYQ